MNAMSSALGAHDSSMRASMVLPVPTSPVKVTMPLPWRSE